MEAVRMVRLVLGISAGCWAAAERNSRSMLERALRTKPNSIPVLEAYCRFLNATNEFVESLVACARTLAFDPWNGLALHHMDGPQ
ncbi:MAG: hypothetical protein PSV22_20015 [Pseudolabrys sp.]|nr:hypothetical protein [Pseudolabrys sp.]